MKKLNITKKQYDESKYFNKKYGALKYMSESGKLYKTDKGVVLALEGQECKNGDCQENESLDDIANAVKKTGGEMVDKVKDGAKKVGKAIGDKMHGIYRKNDRVKISGKAGDMEGAVVSADPNKVVIKPDNERSFDESDDADQRKSHVANSQTCSRMLLMPLRRFVMLKIAPLRKSLGLNQRMRLRKLMLTRLLPPRKKLLKFSLM